MSEIILYRAIIGCLLVYVLVNEWQLREAIKRAYKSGFHFAILTKLPEMQEAMDHFFKRFENDLNYLEKEVNKHEHESSDAQGACEKRNTEAENVTH